jgi:Sensors of blue-light using FAD
MTQSRWNKWLKFFPLHPTRREQDHPVQIMKLIQLIYASAASKPFSAVELRELLRLARAKNERLDITGMLLYHEGSFLQVLEGPDSAVNPLLETIAKDKRHDKVLLLLRREIEARNFGEWKMGFVDVDPKAQSLPGFRDYFKSHASFLELQGDPKMVERILDGFHDGQWRQHIAAE